MERSSDRVCARCDAVMWTGDRVCPRCGEPRRLATPPSVPAQERQRAWSPEGDHRQQAQARDGAPTDQQGAPAGSPLLTTLPLRRDAQDSPPPEHPRRRRGSVLLLVTALLVVALVVAGVALWRTGALDGGGGGDDASAVSPSSAPSTSGPPAQDGDDGTSGEAPSPAAPAGEPLTGGASAQVPSTSADAVDGNGDATSYQASNMLDGDPETTWRMDGDGTGATLTFTLDGAATISEVGLVNGYAKTDPASGADRYAQSRRITAVTWTVGADSFDQQLDDGDRDLQTLPVRPVEGDEVTLRIDAVTGPGNPTFDMTAISEVEILGSRG